MFSTNIVIVVVLVCGSTHGAEENLVDDQSERSNLRAVVCCVCATLFILVVIAMTVCCRCRRRKRNASVTSPSDKTSTRRELQRLQNDSGRDANTELTLKCTAVRSDSVCLEWSRLDTKYPPHHSIEYREKTSNTWGQWKEKLRTYELSCDVGGLKAETVYEMQVTAMYRDQKEVRHYQGSNVVQVQTTSEADKTVDDAELMSNSSVHANNISRERGLSE